MSIRMKRSEIIALNQALLGLNRISSTKFSYAVARNLRVLKDEIEAFNQAQRIELQEKIVEYDRKRVELVNKYASRDLNGKILSNEATGEAYMMNYTAFQEELKPLKDDYADAIKQREEKALEIDKLLEEEVEIEKDFYRIRAEIVPDGLTPVELFHLMPLIEGEIGIDKKGESGDGE